jgi:hypothetical protein
MILQPMKHRWTYLLAFLLLGHLLRAQSPCGTLQPGNAAAYYDRLNAVIQSQMASGMHKQTATITIPTVFHVVYNTPAGNIPDSLIYQQLAILNADFQRMNADTVNTPAAFQGVAGSMDITFCLAQRTPMGAPTTGILRVPTSETSFASPVTYAVPDPVKHTSMGGSDAWDTQAYLNIWVCNLTGSTAYSAPPGNFMPDDEGVVCKYQHVGITNVYPYGEGRSIVHEVGHFFCLKHIWGDDAGACNGTDFINDTPNQGNYSTNCPGFPLTDACSPASPGVMFMNYMDYSEDGCRNMFSAGQCAYMESCITSLRAGFLTATGCVPVVGVGEEDFYNVEVATGPAQMIIRCEGKFMGEVSVCDMQGRQAFHWSGMQSHEIECSTEEWTAGLYIVAIIMEDGTVWRRKMALSMR